MKTLICYAVTFLICFAFGMSKLWLGFVAVLVLFLLEKQTSSLWWEIPMGILSLSILSDIFYDEQTAVLRVLIPIAAILIAYHSPKKLLLFFPVALGALFMKNIYSLPMVWASVWYGGREFIKNRQIHIYHSTIKKQALQGNNSE